MGFSSCGSQAPELRLSSCGARAQLLHSMRDLPGPGLEPVSPALAGGFLTTVPLGKPQDDFLKEHLANKKFFFKSFSLKQKYVNKIHWKVRLKKSKMEREGGESGEERDKITCLESPTTK